MASIIIFLALGLGVPISAAEEPPDSKGEAIFKGELKFLKPENGELYRKGLLELEERRYAEAEKTFRKGRNGVSDKAEVETFERLIREARAGQDLERIQKMGAAKGGGLKALAELKKAIPRAKGLRLLKDLERLEGQIHDKVFYVVEDFEEPSGSGKAGSGESTGSAGGGSQKAGRTGSLGRYGDAGKLLEAKTAGGEIQEADGDPTKVREGKCSYRWAVGKDLRLKVMENEPGVLARYGYLDFSLRGAPQKGAVVQVYLLPRNPNWVQFLLGRFQGYSASVTVKGAAWKDFRLSIDKDFVPREELAKEAVALIVLSVKNQEEQVLYLDDVKLEE